MLELGAYWGFYSMWFTQKVPSARCILVEPDARNIEMGRENFLLNRLQAEFLPGYAASAPAGDPVPAYGVSELMERFGIRRLNILHADIQGAELDMLRSAHDAFEREAIDYVFVSTHSDPLHSQCLELLSAQGFALIAEANTSESFSEDGVIVARRAGLSVPEAIGISRRSK